MLRVASLLSSTSVIMNISLFRRELTHSAWRWMEMCERQKNIFRIRRIRQWEVFSYFSIVNHPTWIYKGCWFIIHLNCCEQPGPRIAKQAPAESAENLLTRDSSLLSAAGSSTRPQLSVRKWVCSSLRRRARWSVGLRQRNEHHKSIASETRSVNRQKPITKYLVSHR